MLIKKEEFSIFRKKIWISRIGYSSDYLDVWKTIKYSSIKQSEETFKMQLKSNSLYDKLYALVGLKAICYQDFECECKKVSKLKDQVSVVILSGRSISIPISKAVDLIVCSDLKNPY